MLRLYIFQFYEEKRRSRTCKQPPNPPSASLRTGSFLRGNRSLPSNIQYSRVLGISASLRPASSIQHPASSIQYPASSIQYPASSIQHQASSIQHPVSSIQHPVSIFLHHNFSAKIRTILSAALPSHNSGILPFLPLPEMIFSVS